MQKLVLAALIVLLVGCVQPEATPTATPVPAGGTPIGAPPSPSPEATATPEPTPTPTPDPYQALEFGQTVEKGDFVVTIQSVGRYTYTPPFGDELVDYRVDLSIRNIASSAREYHFNYSLLGDDTTYGLRWHSPLFAKGQLSPGQEIDGYILFDVGEATGPYKLSIPSIHLAYYDEHVIGGNELEKPVVGAINYDDLCGQSTLGSVFLGSLEGCCSCSTKLTAARDWSNYPSWVNDKVIITRLKVKNNGENGATVMIVDEVPERFGVTARDLVYTHEPIFLDDYHPAWLVRLGRNEIWVTQMNYSIYLEQSEVEAMPGPVTLALNV